MIWAVESRPSLDVKNRIKELRESRNLSLGDLAARVGTTNQQISHLELGKRRLTADWMVRIAAALNYHPWELAEATTLPSLDTQQEQLLKLFRQLSPAERDALLLITSSVAGAKS